MTETKERFYRALLEKYAEIINQAEHRTVGQVKMLVNPEDLTIQSLIQQYKPETYVREKDYLHTAQQVFEFVTKEIKFVPNELNINFWLKPNEIIINKVSDDEDLAVLVCTLLYALGDEHAMVYLMELEDLHTHAVVITKVNGQTLLLDPCTGHNFFKYYGEKAHVFKRYQFNGQKIKRALYRFNAQTYEQFI